ncbi:pentapeptide repeat-containing protein [Endozoicomonas gorgoniicola]|uniref:Pentapeptide repeat-containing protein n=1 Tax=Endozoicomonas gorgoniicola TaxID=1234144 RepID=A0ABT3MPV5_9GAMM|nr:pentapeptide repeat-containing protein [Endozoicomonas gorgoniicola]MCW7551404.1 pentapeptide repeat-containing protein [Endozoicomonas gorgoniicola]
MNSEDLHCAYKGSSGSGCDGKVVSGSTFCFWHCPDIDKSGMELTKRLEKRARTGRPMEGFLLKGANLENVNLVNHDGEPYRLTGADLNRANLHKAHLYQVSLLQCNLLKANLSGANLHFTDLSGCNLLGVNFKQARLDEVYWGDRLLQERLGYEQQRSHQHESAQSLFQEAEEVARNIRRNCESQGLFAIAGDFFYREMVIRRQRYPKWSYDRGLSLLVDLISGYGEKPRRVISFAAGLIILFSFIYLLFGVQEGERLIQYSPDQSFLVNARTWLDTLYYSVVTFTTLGYGDITPVGISRLFAALEAFTGSFSMALFVVVFVKKMSR